MPTIVCNVAALMVAGLFYCWRAYHEAQLKRQRVLHERVTYMLWVMAQNASDEPSMPLSEIGLTPSGA